MLNDHPDPYRWQDHVITPRRAVLNLVATALIVAVVAAAGLLGGGSPGPDASVALATERTPSLAQSVKRPASSLPRPVPFGGC